MEIEDLPKDSGSAPATAAIIERVAEQFRQRGDRMSAARRAVLAVLLADSRHLNAEEVYDGVCAAGGEIHRASAYRALRSLCDLGVVQHVHLGHGATAYHFIGEVGAHAHVQCRKCELVIDFPLGLLQGLAVELADRHGFVLDETHVALSGLCSGCRGLRKVQD